MRDYEAEAKVEGWAPKDEWRGAEEKWIDAQTFVENGEKIQSHLKTKVDRLSEQVDTLRQTNTEFQKYHQKTLEREKSRAEAKISELEAARAQAVTEGDGETFTKTDREIEQLKSEVRVERSELPPEAKNWMGQNDWYQQDDILTNYADGVADKIINAGYVPGSKAYFDELTRRTKTAFPDRFKNQNRDQPSPVDTGGVRETDRKPHSYEALPAEDRAACDRFIRDIPGFTKEQFVATYDWD